MRVLWEPSWRARGRSGTHYGAKRSPEIVKKWSNNSLKIDPKNGPEKEPEMTRKWCPKSIDPGEANGVILGSLSGSWPRGPRGCQDEPRGCQDGPRQTQDRAKMAPDRPKTAQDRPKKVQDKPMTVQDSRKTGVRWPNIAQDGPRQI